MKTLTTSAVLIPLLVGCGATHTNSQAMDTECSYSLPAGTSVAAMQQAVNAVLDGSLNPCGGAVDLNSRNVALTHIDASVEAGVQRFTLAFSVSMDEVSRNQVSRNQVSTQVSSTQVSRNQMSRNQIAKNDLQ